MKRGRTRVLMFAEAVTLAHLARPLALARALDPDKYEVVLACDSRYRKFYEGGAWDFVDLHSIAPEQFMDALARGAPVYDERCLASYIDEDLERIDAVGPDLVVGDFRLSLAVSARERHVPYVAISNAYWHPGYRREFPLPVLPISRLLPLPLARLLFKAFRPLAFAFHCRPMNRLMARHGLPSLGHDLRKVYTDADHVLLSDVHELHPLQSTDVRHSYIGPLLWSPDVSLPPWWDERDDRPVIYVNLGSSGPHSLLPTILGALASLPVRVWASTAGVPFSGAIPENARLAPYLPGGAATAKACLVICNGGSMTVQQALSEGVPVMGVASNMDQFMSMCPVVEAGAGEIVRADRCSRAAIAQGVRTLLRAQASSAAKSLRMYFTGTVPVGQSFDRVAEMLLAGKTRP